MSELIENPVVKSLDEVLDRRTRYKIPMYQRDYSWGETEIEAFLDDLYAIAESEEEHFFGTIVLSKDSPGEAAFADEKIRFVIDGQQRLTTSLLFIAVLRHQFAELADTQPTIHRFLVKLDELLHLGDGEPEAQIPRLYANRTNQVFLQAILTGRTVRSEDVAREFRNLGRENKPGSKRINVAYQFIQKSIFKRAKVLLGKEYTGNETSLSVLVDDVSECDVLVEHFKRIELAFREKSAFVEITVRKWQDAFSLFDGLNNRGLELAKRDIVKNVVFARAAGHELQPEAFSVLLEKWRQLEKLVPESKFGNFMRHYLFLTNDTVMLKNVVRIFLAETDSQSAETILGILEKAGNAYNRILDPEKEENLQIQNRLTRLKVLGAERVYPIILSCQLGSLTVTQQLEVLRALETLYFRRSAICQMDNKDIEKKIQSVAANLYAHGSSKVSDALSEIDSWNPTDQEFLTLFKVRRGIDPGIARYMLLEIENSMRPGHPIESTTLEHILPQDPSLWGLDGNSEETQVLIQQLGNLTILTNSDNSRIQNFPFDDKKVVYKEENLKINALVVESSQWGKDEIAARQQKLSEHILALWPRR
jgi:uncharacterized protein with ParB-like and HNH nuclease domain